MLTKNGVCYNLPLSPYHLCQGDITFYFSSEGHMDKFVWEHAENEEKINESMWKRFKVLHQMKELADILLYKKIESRGFYIEIKGVPCLCLSDLQLNGQISKQKNSNDRSSDSTQS